MGSRWSWRSIAALAARRRTAWSALPARSTTAFAATAAFGTLTQFLIGDLAVTVFVECLEHPRQVVFLLLGEELACNKSIGCLFKGLINTETLEVVERVYRHCFIDSDVRKFRDPGMFKGLFGAWTILLLVGEQLSDEVFRFGGYGIPTLITETVVSSTDFFEDFTITLAVKRRHS